MTRAWVRVAAGAFVAFAVVSCRTSSAADGGYDVDFRAEMRAFVVEIA
jgi:hypothetical protein